MSTVQIETRMVDIDLIDEPAWDSRVVKSGSKAKEEQKAIDKMAAEFANPKIGQLQPIVIEVKEGGRFERIFGGRRLKAARINNMKQIRAEIRAPSTETDRMLRNIAENMDREPLTTFEAARAATKLAEMGFKNAEISDRIKTNDGEKMSTSHISNLRAAYAGVPAAVAKEWEQENPVATVNNLCEIARKGKDDEDKLKMWDALEAKVAAEGRKPGKRGKGKGKDEGATSAGFPVSQKRLGYMVQALSSKTGSPDLDDSVRRWGKALLDYIMKGRETPPADVPKPEVKTKKESDK